jgi:hypothetical protein
VTRDAESTDDEEGQEEDDAEAGTQVPEADAVITPIGGQVLCGELGLGLGLDGRNYDRNSPSQSNCNIPKPYGMGGPSPQSLPARYFGASLHLENQALANARANRDFEMALVDAFLLARKFIPKWRNCDDSESSFFRFLRELLPTIADTNEALAARQMRSKCSQTSLGKALYNQVQNKARNMRNKDVATTASRGRRKKTRKGLSAPEELRTPAVAIQRSIAAKRDWAIAG